VVVRRKTTDKTRILTEPTLVPRPLYFRRRAVQFTIVSKEFEANVDALIADKTIAPLKQSRNFSVTESAETTTRRNQLRKLRGPIGRQTE
jgi:hypothetical protein